MSRATLHCGDVREVLARLPEASVQCVVTSPPYWSLRDYGVSGQLGLEPTPGEYVRVMVEVFQVVHRVLRDDGVLWVNLGDSYASNWPCNRRSTIGAGALENGKREARPPRMGGGLKDKDLVGIPWRVALALQEDGWVLRSDVVWSKPNPMPESVTDRPTRSHEYLFMFSKARWAGEPPRFTHIAEQDARWLALFLDTEGSIVCKRATSEAGKTIYGAQLCFASTSLPLLQTARQIIGHGTILHRPGRNAEMHYLQLSNRRAADLLRRLHPYLIVKQRQAALGVYLQSVLADGEHERRTKEGRLRGRGRADAYTAILERIWVTMKELNHFGTPDLSWVPTPTFGRWNSQRYYYDAAAIAEPGSLNSHGGLPIEGGPKQQALGQQVGGRMGLPAARKTDKQRGHSRRHAGFNDRWDAMERAQQCSGMRNARSVWTIATQPYPQAHFATFPEELARRCILAGSKPGDMILDPFGGSGTVAQVATGNGRDAVYIDLNPAYVELAKQRIGPMLCDNAALRGTPPGDAA